MSAKQCYKPCPNCPFRVDSRGFITPERGEEIQASLERGGMFPCHKTVDYKGSTDGEGRVTANSVFCAGALIVMERSWDHGAVENQAVRIAGRLGLLDLDKLDMDAPVAEDFDAWIDWLEESETTPNPEKP